MASTAPTHTITDLPHREVVDISSDDESVDDGQPESSRRSIYLTPPMKRVVDADSGDDDDDDEPISPLDFLYRMLEPGRTKRQKLDHSDSINTTNKNPAAGTAVDTNWTGLPWYEYRNHEPSVSPEPMNRNWTDAGKVAPLPYRPNTDLTAPTTYTTFQDTLPIGMLHPRTRRRVKEYKAKPATPPYYDDVKLEVRMYRGPGYERFPIVLGTDPEHQAVCDQWDRLQEARRKRKEIFQKTLANSTTNAIVDEESDNETDFNESVADKSELDCISLIREVLPDIQHDFALEQIRRYLQFARCTADDGAEVRMDPAAIVSNILELSEYPKESVPKKDKLPASDGTGVTIEWEKGDTNSTTYAQNAIRLLAGQFEHIPTIFISKTVHNKKSLFESYQYLHTVDTNYPNMQPKERPYSRPHIPRTVLEKKYAPKEREQRSKLEWNNLVNELQAAKQKIERDALRTIRDQKEAEIEENNLQEQKACGNVVECQCCFDDEIPVNRAVFCEGQEMHWFCFGCTRRLAESQVGLMRYEMTCMHESGCRACLSGEGIKLAISAQLLDKLGFYQQQAEINAADLEGLEQCPFCDFKAICDPVEVDPVFRCQNPDCKHNSCRKCFEDSHVPKSCEEAKKDKQISARHQVEEARSEALIRSCPRCKVKIVKEVGCNKMQCVKCGCVMCYVCKSDISGRRDGGYGHFNEPGSKCVLYDKHHNRHEVEVDEAERAAIKKVQAENADIDEKQLQIDTDGTKKKTERLKVHPHLGRFYDLDHRRGLPIGDGQLNQFVRAHAARHAALVQQAAGRGLPLARVVPLPAPGNARAVDMPGRRGVEQAFPAGLPVIGNAPANYDGYGPRNHARNVPQALHAGLARAVDETDRNTPPAQQLLQDPFRHDHAVLDNMYGPWNGFGQALAPDVLHGNRRQNVPYGMEDWLHDQRGLAQLMGQRPANYHQNNAGEHDPFGWAHYHYP